MRIPLEKTAGLVIDVQERLYPHIHEREALARNVGILVEGLKIMGVPLLVTQQYTKGLGPTISELSELSEMHRHFVLIAGIESHVCVLQTVIDLIEKGYQPVLVEDCVASRKAGDKTISVKRMCKEGAIVTSYESILFELCRFSGTDRFRAISKLVK
jgi:nicotinamidase-related amidase